MKQYGFYTIIIVISYASYNTNESNFQPQQPLPTVVTEDITHKNIAAGLATFNGTITNTGEPAYTERGFVYGIAHNPTIDDNAIKVVSGSGIGAYSSDMSEFVIGTVYYVRAYAINTGGMVYGEEKMLDFKAIMPIVTTNEPKFISATSVMLHGTITNIGDPVYTECGFVYDTIPTLDSATTKVIANKIEAGIFNVQIKGLSSNTYYVRAYITNTEGTVYGGIQTISKNAFSYFSMPTFEYNGHTYRVYNDMGSMNWALAMATCNNLLFAGYDDWFLPNKEELDVMYKQKDSIGGFSSYYYWSSLEVNSDNAWIQNFSNGLQFCKGSKNSLYLVRPIRKVN